MLSRILGSFEARLAHSTSAKYLQLRRLQAAHLLSLGMLAWVPHHFCSKVSAVCKDYNQQICSEEGEEKSTFIPVSLASSPHEVDAKTRQEDYIIPASLAD